MGDNTTRRKVFVDMRRKSLLFDKLFSEGHEGPSKERALVSSMKDYIKLMREERFQWKEILESRRKQLEHIKNIWISEATDKVFNEGEAYLNEEDRIFVNDAPDYFTMLKSVHKYLNAVEFFQQFKSDIIEYYDEILEQTEKESNTLVNHFHDTAVCELCSQTNCNNQGHKFPTDTN